LSKEKEAQDIRSIDEHLKLLRQDMDRKMSELKVQVDQIQEKAGRTITKRPMLALGVAFVAGMAVGIALSKSND